MTGFGQCQIASVALDVLAEDVAPAPGAVRLALGQVVAGAERAAGAGDRDDADPVVVGGLGDRRRSARPAAPR